MNAWRYTHGIYVHNQSHLIFLIYISLLTYYHSTSRLCLAKIRKCQIMVIPTVLWLLRTTIFCKDSGNNGVIFGALASR